MSTPGELHVGFTGTRTGMTLEQTVAVADALARWSCDHDYSIVGHHGDCVGADAEFHSLCRSYGGGRVVIHPPDDPSRRAFCRGYDTIHPELPYLTRNRTIVNDSDVLLVCPAENIEQLRSGTWSTVRYALRVGRQVCIVLPDGSWDIRE